MNPAFLKALLARAIVYIQVRAAKDMLTDFFFSFGKPALLTTVCLFLRWQIRQVGRQWWGKKGPVCLAGIP